MESSRHIIGHYNQYDEEGRLASGYVPGLWTKSRETPVLFRKGRRDCRRAGKNKFPIVRFV